jgi:hypothetical protein
MINKKEKILRNYLNNETFKENLMKQQNKLLKLYNKENNNNLEDFSYIKPSTLYYNNKSLNLSEGNFNTLLENNDKNIYIIRLEQTKEVLIELSQRKWPNITICKNILDIKGNVKIIINNNIYNKFRKKEFL